MGLTAPNSGSSVLHSNPCGKHHQVHHFIGRVRHREVKNCAPKSSSCKPAQFKATLKGEVDHDVCLP